jgi:hypothetical protein
VNESRQTHGGQIYAGQQPRSKDISSETPNYKFSISRVPVTDISLSMRCRKLHKTGLIFYDLLNKALKT